MARKLTAWNKAVKATFAAGKAKNPSYSFKQALQDASAMQKGGNDASLIEAKILEQGQKNSNNVAGEDEKIEGGSALEGSPINAETNMIPKIVSKHTGGRKSKRHHHKKKGNKSHKKHKKTRHH